MISSGEAMETGWIAYRHIIQDGVQIRMLREGHAEAQ